MKLEDAHLLIDTVNQALSSFITPNSLTLNYVKSSVILEMAQLNWIESFSKTRLQSEKQQYRQTYTSNLEALFSIIRSHGCSANLLFDYLELHDKIFDRICTKLTKDLTEDGVNSKYSQLNQLRQLLQTGVQVCETLYDVNHPEAAGLLALIRQRIGILYYFEDVLKSEYESRQPEKDVVSKYLDEMQQEIDVLKQGQIFTKLQLANQNIQAAYDLLHDQSPLKPELGIFLQLSNGNLEDPIDLHDIGQLRNVLKQEMVIAKLLTAPVDEEIKFERLALLQHAACKRYLLDIFLSNSAKAFKDSLLLQLTLNHSLRKLIYYEKQLTDVLQHCNIYKVLSYSPTFHEIKERMPASTATFILQFSPDWSIGYAGMITLDKEKVANYWTITHKLNDEEQAKYKELTLRIRNLKRQLEKTPTSSQEEINENEHAVSQELHQILSELTSLLFWIQEPLYLSLCPPEPPEPVEEPGAKKKAPPPPKKDDKAVIDPSIPLPSSGIHTLLLCLDHRLLELPIELLQHIRSVPIITRDFSLQSYDYKFKNILPLSKDMLKFAVEKPKHQAALEECNLMLGEFQVGKWEGILGSERGEWERLSMHASLLLRVNSEGINEEATCSLSAATFPRAAVLLDRFYTIKQSMTNFKTRERPSAAIMTCLGVPLVVVNSWPLQPLMAYQFARMMWKGLSTQQSIATYLYNFKHGHDDIIHKAAIVTYGFPLLKLSQ